MSSPLPGGATWLRLRLVVLGLGLGALTVAGIASCGDDAGPGPDGDPDSAALADRTGDNPAGCLDEASAGGDLFPDKFQVEHAENLSIEYHDTYKVVTVSEPYPGGSEQSYVLLQCGAEAPDPTGDLADAPIVEVPVGSLFSQSTSHLGFVDELGVADVVTGVADPDLVVVPSVRERIDRGDAVGFAANGAVDTEAVMLEDPDVFVTMGTEDPGHDVLASAGVPVLANAEWLETSPLAWAEWIGFFAALTNTEARAQKVFAGIQERYEDVVELTANVEIRPTVITGALVSGDWSARGGAGIVPRFIADAGGDYVYADDPSTGNLVLDIERVLTDARDADVWISPGGGFTSRAEAAGIDDRYLQLAAWDAGGVWDDVDERDGLSRFEHGPVMIDVMLLDYVKILHPELAEGHELTFFDRVD